jgi:hypothetical protein
VSASWLIPDFPDSLGTISTHGRRENERLWFEHQTRLHHALAGGFYFYDPPSPMTGQARFDMEMREIRRQHDEMRRQLREMHKHFPEQVAQGGVEKMPKCPKDCICPKCLDARWPAPGKVIAAQPLPPGVHLAARQRVGDEQRNIFLDRLRGAYEDGYIDLTEFGARQDAAMKAVTEDELKLLMADLPDMKVRKIPEPVISGESSVAVRWFHSPGLYLTCLLVNACCAVFTIFFLLPTLAGQILLPFSSGLAAICTVHLLRLLYKKGMTDPGR